MSFVEMVLFGVVVYLVAWTTEWIVFQVSQRMESKRSDAAHGPAIDEGETR